MRRLMSVGLLGSGVVMLTVSLGSFRLRAPDRWAVIVGVNDYRAFGPDEPGGDLEGAENDALSFRDVLADRWGFTEERTRVLLGSDASKAAIRDALTVWLPARARDGDLVVFYFAGHGSQAIDQDGDEPDGLDETLCPWDVWPDSPDNDILDDELRAWLRDLPTRNVAVVVDACHSGTVTRLHSALRTRRLARTLPPTQGVSTRGDAAGPSREQEGDALPPGVVELAATAPEEVAQEGPYSTDAEGRPRSSGAFTTYLVRALWEAPANATYEALHRRVAAAMRADQLDQRPQFSGPGGLRAFGGPSADPRAAPHFDTELLVGVASLPPALKDELAGRARQAGGVTLVEDAGTLPHVSLRLEAGGDVTVVGRDGRIRRRVSGGSDPAEVLWAMLERERVLRELASLENPAGGFGVEVEARGDSFAVGEEISFRVRSERAGFLTLLDLGTSGAVTLLYPNPFDELGRVPAGTWVDVPGPRAVFTVDGPLGVGAVRAVVSDRPLALGREEGTFLSVENGGEVTSALRRALSQGSVSWASGITLYRVVR